MSKMFKELNTKMFKGGDIDNPDDWIECLPFSGYGKNLPVGGTIPPGLKGLMSFIKYVVILDAESDEEYRIVKKSEFETLGPNTEIIGVQLAEKALAMIEGEKGANSEAILIADPQSGHQYTRMGWWENHDNTDGLAMVAASRLIASLKGPGIHF